MGDFIAALQRYCTFTREEVRDIFIIAIVFGFIISFRDWGEDTFNAITGIENLLKGFLIAGIALFFKFGFQKAFALKRGYQIEFKVWGIGLFLGVLITLVSRGHLMLLLPAGVVLFHMGGMRLGRFRYGLNMFDVALVSLMGPVANIILAIIWKLLLLVAPENIFFAKAFLVNVTLAVTSILPIPFTDGGNTFFGSRTLWAFGIGAMVSAAALLYLIKSPFIAIIPAIIVGIAIGIAWYSEMEP